MPKKPSIEAYGKGIRLRVRVQPKASRNALYCESGGRLKVALTAPPVDGKANKALLIFLAKFFGVPKSVVSLSAGERSRDKTILVDGISEEFVLSKIDELSS